MFKTFQIAGPGFEPGYMGYEPIVVPFQRTPRYMGIDKISLPMPQLLLPLYI